MKKTLAFVLGTLMVLLLCFSVMASGPDNHVFAQPVTVEAGERVSVPIRIENNKGFMGFSLTITYDTEIFTPVSAVQGSAIFGMFNDSIELQTPGSFKVVFSATEDMTRDGEICVLTFDVAKGVSGEQKIGVTYSKQDTFNEKWTDVVLSCEDVQVIVTENGTTAPPVTEPESEPQTQPEKEPQTEPATGPQTQPTVPQKALSQQLRDWINGRSLFLRILLKPLILFVAWVISLSEG